MLLLLLAATAVDAFLYFDLPSSSEINAFFRMKTNTLMMRRCRIKAESAFIICMRSKFGVAIAHNRTIY